jgi:tRNA pseudouridine38-40 synthase
MRIALGLEYDGGAFRGWQSQTSGGTVQDALEAALSRIAGERIRAVCAGRTDAGVHATDQVVHFDTAALRPLNAWTRGVNALLPPSMAARWACEVPEEFHARFSARARAYRYLLLNRPERPGIEHARVGWHHRRLDAEAMQDAARLLVGTNDFSAFRAAGCQAKTPVRTLFRADVGRDADHIVFDFEADAFLYHMVRNLVGALVHVGLGKRPPDWIAEVLDARDRRRAAPTFPAAGLYLVGVYYDPVWCVEGFGGQSFSGAKRRSSCFFPFGGKESEARG